MPIAPATPLAVIFDLDGTLVDSETLHFASMSAAAQAMGCELSEDLAGQLSGLSSEACHALLQRNAGLIGSFADFVEAKHTLYLANSASLAMRNGAAVALSYLADLKIPYAIASNSVRAVVNANIGAIGMDASRIVSVSRDDVEVGKPDPEPFLKAASLLGVAPQLCLAVEDSVPGALSAHAAGMRVVGWPEPHRSKTVFPDSTNVADPLNLRDTLASYFGSREV